MNRIRCNLIIYYAILLQFITVAFILFSAENLQIARLGVFYQWFKPPYIGAYLMLASVTLACVGLLTHSASRTRLLLFLPQFGFMLLTAGSALSYTFMGHYADGVVRGWSFIFLDQLPAILSTFLYMFAILDFTKKPEKVLTGGEHGTK